jgi:hypothetical protein
MSLVKLWLKENISTYPGFIKSRLLRYATDRQIDLTRISRVQLHPVLDPVLFDKTQVQIAVAAVSTIALSLFYIWARVIMAAVFVVLIFSALFLGDARMFEPFIPITIFMALAPAIPFWQFLKRRLQTPTLEMS